VSASASFGKISPEVKSGMTTNRPTQRIQPLVRAVSLLVIALMLSQAAENPEVRVKNLLASQKFQTATEFLRSHHGQFVDELIRLTEIPAPSFKEDARAKAYLQMLSEAGLSNVEMDREGNVIGLRKGAGGESMLAVLAHLDTVFPEETDLTVKRTGTRLAAPGVGDDSRGLAVVLQIIRAMDKAKFQTTSDILFVGDVGEEGEGWSRSGTHWYRRRRREAIPSFVFRAARSQLFGFRTREPGVCDGIGHGENGSA
jgi:acetylornithine deacetylase/succinyl-diaminopimelate desuccinylase-like protein